MTRPTINPDARDYTISVAQTAMNILDGTEYHANYDALQRVWEHSLGCGFDGFCAWLAEFAIISEDKLRDRSPLDFPGVYDYEVAYELGQKIKNYMLLHGEVPTHERASQWLTELIDTFFRQGENR